jgi:hypothetical protein
VGLRPQAPRGANDQPAPPLPEVFHVHLPFAVPAYAEGTIPSAQPHSEHRLRTRREQPHSEVLSSQSSDAVGCKGKIFVASFATVLLMKPGERLRCVRLPQSSPFSGWWPLLARPNRRPESTLAQAKCSFVPLRSITLSRSSITPWRVCR